MVIWATILRDLEPCTARGMPVGDSASSYAEVTEALSQSTSRALQWGSRTRSVMGQDRLDDRPILGCQMSEEPL